MKADKSPLQDTNSLLKAVVQGDLNLVENALSECGTHAVSFRLKIPFEYYDCFY